MTMPAFAGPGFAGCPLGGIGYTGGPMYGPMNSAPKFEPVIYSPISIPKFDPLANRYENRPGYDELFAKPHTYLDDAVTRLDKTPSDPFGTIGGNVFSLESTKPKREYGVFSDAYGITPSGRIKHLFDY